MTLAMGVRRILTAARTDRGVPSLAMKEETLAAPADGSPDVLVRSECALIDFDSLPGAAAPDGPLGSLIGTVEQGSTSAGLLAGHPVVGVGPLADRLVLPPDRVQPLQGDGAGAAGQVFLPVFSAVLGALREAGIEPGTRIGVCGEGLVARVVTRLAQLSSGIAPWTFAGAAGAAEVTGADDPAGADELDILIDATADPNRWSPELVHVRREGRVVLLVPPGAQVRSLDFYPGVHRRSLTVLARRVPAIRRPLVSDEARRLVPHVLGHGAVAFEDWFVEVEVRPQGPHVPLMPRDALVAGRGLLIRWS